jgi:glycosyltransferase involved in cell wall biosynthesis
MNNSTMSVDSVSNASIRPVVVIPVYNNRKTIGPVIEDARRFCADIIVVNDGCTDGTADELNAVSGIDRIDLLRNRGKGAALREGFTRARARGFTHAITMDADGQHLGDDIELFRECIRQSPDAIWIGDRRIPDNDAGQPLRSSLGRRFGAFWYRFHTGIRINDTQCGFRAYPLDAVLELGCRGERYAYELELIIHAAWNGIPVKEVPIHLRYFPREERVSHFRPWRDFLRLSGVNSRAALTRIFLPWRTLAVPGLTAREKVLWLVKQEMKANATPRRAAASLALGVFMAISPLYGFQVLLVLLLSFLLHLNRPLSLIGVSISPPPLLPAYMAAAIFVGAWIVPVSANTMSTIPLLKPVMKYGIQWFIGSWILACAAGGITFGIALAGFRKMARRKCG